VTNDTERRACTPLSVNPAAFNPKANLPHGCTAAHIQSAMGDFLDFLGFINEQLNKRNLARLESMLMTANFSSIVGEFMASSIPNHCKSLVKNRYHNGHPDLIPTGKFPGDAAQHSAEGIEIKGSHYLKGWQGHNPEDCFLLVFVFDSNRPADAAKNVKPRPFRFVQVLGARLTKKDWLFSGGSETSRRTITASVMNSGYQKMAANWIYKSPELNVGE
jgi:hypothetical protein